MTDLKDAYVSPTVVATQHFGRVNGMGWVWKHRSHEFLHLLRTKTSFFREDVDFRDRFHGGDQNDIADHLQERRLAGLLAAEVNNRLSDAIHIRPCARGAGA